MHVSAAKLQQQKEVITRLGNIFCMQHQQITRVWLLRHAISTDRGSSEASLRNLGTRDASSLV